jgi:hypothetical protein
MRYAVLAAAANHGGVDVDMLEEVVYWGTEDFRSYGAFAAVAWIPAVADQRGIDLVQLCSRLRAGPGLQA